MKKINIRRLYYLVRYKYLTLNNVVITVALLIGASWAWGSVGVMQRNYTLQKDVNYKNNQLQVAELETRNLDLENRYYRTKEYQELAARKVLGLVMPGESVLILPDNTPVAKTSEKVSQTSGAVVTESVSNYQQWINFLFSSTR